ncbi:MAG: signal peptidase I [Clostridia bacterium]|nr:signal peptidase I [Clostridia bacterium]
MKKFFNIITDLIVFILLFTICYIMFSKIILKKDKVSVLGYNFYVILSGSMEPKININDIVIIKNTKDIKEDDIIAFQDNGHITVHRVIEEKKDLDNNKKVYITKGDNNNTRDEAPVTESIVEGKYVGKIPLIGWAIIMISEYFLAFIFYLLALVFILILLRQLAKIIVSNKNNNKENTDDK